MFDNLNYYEIWILVCIAPVVLLISWGVINEIGVSIRKRIGMPTLESSHFKNSIFGLIAMVAIYIIGVYILSFLNIL